MNHQPATEPRVNVRWMIQGDLPQVLAIETASFDHPWCETDFRRALAKRNQIGMVAEFNDCLLGYVVYAVQKRMLRLDNFAVSPQYRRIGVGGRLLQELKDKLPSRRYLIVAYVRETNVPMQQFLRAHGFRAEHIHREWFEDTGEDAYEFLFSAKGPYDA